MKKIIDLLNELHPEYDYLSSPNFIESGILDSFDIIYIVSSIEEEYNVKIDPFDIVPENFTSVDSIQKMIDKNKSD